MTGTLRALALSTHPGPTVAVTAITVILGMSVGVDASRLVLLGAMVLANQISVGLSNDWIDAERDRAVGRRDKPVARGDVSASTVRNAAIAAVAVSVLVSLPLGPGAVAANVMFTASAWSYNVGLKSTPLSVLPYLVSFGLLPSLATLSLATPSLSNWWSAVAGALLGAAAHFANVLPDLAADAATGVRGLPHRWGAGTTAVATCLALIAAATVLTLGPAGPASIIGWIGGAVTIVIAAIGIVLAARGERGRPLFRLIIAAAAVKVIALAADGAGLGSS